MSSEKPEPHLMEADNIRRHKVKELIDHESGQWNMTLVSHLFDSNSVHAILHTPLPNCAENDIILET